MQLQTGLLLLLTSVLLLHDACCHPTDGHRSLREAEPDAVGESEDETRSHLGEVSVDNGEETPADVEIFNMHGHGMESAIQEIASEVLEAEVQPTGNIGDMIEELAAEYVNGTRQGEPSSHHSALDISLDNITVRSFGKRQWVDVKYRWEKGIVPYTFDEIRGPEFAMPDSRKESTRKAMKYYEERTCIRFKLKTPTVHTDNGLSHTNYLRYIDAPKNFPSCYSYVGNDKSVGPGQQCACCFYSMCIHEIGHSLGLDHEHRRNDRDLYAKMHEENAMDGIKWEFVNETLDLKNLHPYDYGSVMHYGQWDYSENGRKTLSITDKTDEFLLGNRQGYLSHYDLMGVTKFYDCTDKCPDDKKALVCENDGFLDVHCKCNCPDVFTGDLCENLRTPNCGSIIELTESTPSVNISSPNYPQNYSNSQECIWYIKGPKGKQMVLDFDDFDFEEDVDQNCVDSLEIRDTLVAQPGEKYCGKGYKAAVISYTGFIIMILRTGEKESRKGFSSTTRIVTDEEQCYNTKDRGSSYRGTVDYSQLYHKCIPWEEAKHCPVNLFTSTYSRSGLTGHSYCRNPNNLLRPWCYINKYCEYDFCDVSGLGKCHDIYAECAELTSKDAQYCSTDDAFRGCHKTCNFCGRGHEKLVSSCSVPVLKDKNAVINPSQVAQRTFAFGEKVEIECKNKIDDKPISRELTCTSNGKFLGNSRFCGIDCQEGWTHHRDGCYKYMNKKVYYSLAKKSCKREKAHLVGIEDAVENNFVLSLGSGSVVWIGYNDYDNDGTWTWHDGVKRTYTNWKSKVPSDDKYDKCAVMERDGKWDNIYCDKIYPQTYVCKKPHKISDPDYYCVDEFSKCKDLIGRNYKVCKENQEFSLTHCRSSCGSCAAVSACTNPEISANVVQKTTGESITTGNYFEYECSSGYELGSGNLGRTCLKDGTLSGTTPVCKPEAEFDDTYGHQVFLRKILEKPYMLTVHDSKETNIKRDGQVIKWEVYSTARATLLAQVWRRTALNTTFILIGQTFLNLLPNRANTYTLKNFETFHVQTGDLIGWYTTSTQGLTYSDCTKAWAKRYIYSRGYPVNMDLVKVGMKATLPMKDSCRTYSIAITIGSGEPVDTHYVNVAAASRGATCAEASSNKDLCGLAIDEALMPFNNAWITENEGVGAFIKIDFDAKYKLIMAKIMQRVSNTGQIEGLTLTFSDDSKQEVTLYESQGRKATDTTAAIWNTFDLRPVLSDSVKVSVDTVYSTDYNGFIEIEMLADQLDIFVGNPAQSNTCHDDSDSNEELRIESGSTMTFTRSGFVKAWKLHSNSAANITLMVVRPVYGCDTKFTIVGMNDIEAPNGKAAVIPVAIADRISVKAGDLIAWYYWPSLTAPTIPYSICHSSEKKIIWAGKGPYDVHQKVSGIVSTLAPCRTYSISAQLGRVGPSPYSIMGNAAEPGPHIDGPDSKKEIKIERSFSMTFNKPGTVRAWKLYSTDAVDISLMVVRPLEGSELNFTIVGINKVKAPNEKTAIIPVATADRICVKAGDIIAWYYINKPTIPYVPSGGRSAIYDLKNAFASRQPTCDVPGTKTIGVAAGQGPFTVGQEVSGTVITLRPCRTYSIGAIFDHAYTSPSNGPSTQRQPRPTSPTWAGRW